MKEMNSIHNVNLRNYQYKMRFLEIRNKHKINVKIDVSSLYLFQTRKTKFVKTALLRLHTTIKKDLRE